MTEILLAAIALLVGADLALKVKEKGSGGKSVTPSPKSFPFESLFRKHSKKYGVPVRDMVAIVSYESNFDPHAMNPEEEADARKGRNVDSIGLGMILFPDTARDYDPSATPDKLKDPDYNLDMAFRHFSKRLKLYPSRERGGFAAKATAAYNAGSPRYKADGTYVNQVYVDRVRKHFEKWEGVS